VHESRLDVIFDEEKDILQEIMNIAFGQAAAELAALINIHVILSVPYIKILRAAHLPEYIVSEVRDYGNISIIEQNYWGKFKGTAYLIFPSAAGKELISIMDDGGGNMPWGFESIDVLEREVLMEIGNILIGACTGKITELLKDVVTYSPPRVIIKDHPHNVIPGGLFNPDLSAIVMKTVFTFSGGKVNGYLFMVIGQDSISWLKKSLIEFVEQYG
jgi:chemotaxis protein CheC